jgi:hypothetical protein
VAGARLATTEKVVTVAVTYVIEREGEERKREEEEARVGSSFQ